MEPDDALGGSDPNLHFLDIEWLGDEIIPARVERPDHPRLSLTYPVINAAECVAFLASGEAKREMLRRVVEGDQTLPAARVSSADTVVLADVAAAGELGATPGC